MQVNWGSWSGRRGRLRKIMFCFWLGPDMKFSKSFIRSFEKQLNLLKLFCLGKTLWSQMWRNQFSQNFFFPFLTYLNKHIFLFLLPLKNCFMVPIRSHCQNPCIFAQLPLLPQPSWFTRLPVLQLLLLLTWDFSSGSQIRVFVFANSGTDLFGF